MSIFFFFQTASSASDYDTAGSIGEAPSTGAIADPELDALIDRAMDSSSSEARSELAVKRGRKRGRPPKVASAIDKPRTASASSDSSHRMLRSESKRAGKR